MSESVRPFSLSDLPVLTGTEAAAFDAAAIQGLGVPEAALMERAGSAAARIIHELAPAGSVTVLAGKGNNGGDAVVVARCLTAWGRDVSLLSTDDGDAHSIRLSAMRPISREGIKWT